MTMVFKVSKPTYDVLTTGNANLSFSSELATHSIYNIVSLNKPVDDASVTHTHSLGYIPKVWIFLKENDGEDYLVRIPLDRDVDGESVDYYITTTTIVIEVEDSTIEYDFEVIIFTRSPNI